MTLESHQLDPVLFQREDVADVAFNRPVKASFLFRKDETEIKWGSIVEKPKI